MNRLIGVLVAGAVTLLAAPDVAAQSWRSGWYGGLDVGVALPRDIDIRGRTDDIPTNCDGHFPDVEVDGRTLPLPLDHPDCAPGAEGWENHFDIDGGPLLGFHAGYAWRALRIEAEYVHRRHGGNRSASTITGSDKQAEFVFGAERLSDVEADAFFGNVYYDFRGAPFELIPYVGAGMGLIAASTTYSTTYHRNPDSNIMRTLGRHPAAAGTLSVQEATLSDRLWAYQWTAGIDYPLVERFVLGVEVRHVKPEELSVPGRGGERPAR